MILLNFGKYLYGDNGLDTWRLPPYVSIGDSSSEVLGLTLPDGSDRIYSFHEELNLELPDMYCPSDFVDPLMLPLIANVMDRLSPSDTEIKPRLCVALPGDDRRDHAYVCAHLEQLLLGVRPLKGRWLNPGPRTVQFASVASYPAISCLVYDLVVRDEYWLSEDPTNPWKEGIQANGRILLVNLSTRITEWIVIDTKPLQPVAYGTFGVNISLILLQLKGFMQEGGGGILTPMQAEFALSHGFIPLGNRQIEVSAMIKAESEKKLSRLHSNIIGMQNKFSVDRVLMAGEALNFWYKHHALPAGSQTVDLSVIRGLAKIQRIQEESRQW